jgi:hypothetical protein
VIPLAERTSCRDSLAPFFLNLPTTSFSPRVIFSDAFLPLSRLPSRREHIPSRELRATQVIALPSLLASPKTKKERQVINKKKKPKKKKKAKKTERSPKGEV